MDSKYLKKYLDKWVLENETIKSCNSIGIAISGGPDSVALLDLLSNSKHFDGKHLFCIHINHELRGEESLKDQEYVKKLAHQYNIPCIVKKIDVKNYDKEEKVSLEEGARILRYKILNDIAIENKAIIAIGHTADDTVETFLFNLMRGTGLKGLIGIPEVRDNFIRPLLGIWKEEIMQYLEIRGIKWREDHSNKQTQFTRNKIRNELIPYIEKNYSRQVKKHIRQTQYMLDEVYTITQDNLKSLTKQYLIFKNDYVTIWQAEILKLSNFYIGEILKGIYYQFNYGFRNFDYEKVVKTAECLRSCKPGGCITLKQKGNETLRAEKCSDMVIFARLPREPSKVDFNTQIKETHINLSDFRGSLDFKVTDKVSDQKYIDTDENFCYISYNENDLLSISEIHQGERFTPLGLKAEKKVFRFLLDRKIPSIFRSYLFLVKIANEVAWVPGVGISDKFKIKEHHDKVLKCIWQSPLADILRRIRTWKKI